MKIIRCEKLDNPPVGLSDVSDEDDGFNVNLDQMEFDQWYSFQYDLDEPLYIKLTKDRTLMYCVKKPTFVKELIFAINNNSPRESNT